MLFQFPYKPQTLLGLNPMRPFSPPIALIQLNGSILNGVDCLFSFVSKICIFISLFSHQTKTI